MLIYWEFFIDLSEIYPNILEKHHTTPLQVESIDIDPTSTQVGSIDIDSVRLERSDPQP